MNNNSAEWECSTCTLLNANERNTCAICNASRPLIEEELKHDNSIVCPQKKNRSYPLSIFLLTNMATAFSCVICSKIPHKCYTNEDNGQVLCENCSEIQSKNGVATVFSKGMQNMIQNMKIRCLNNKNQSDIEDGLQLEGETIEMNECKEECLWIGSLKDWNEHNLHSCALIILECPYFQYGCKSKTFGREELKLHLEEEKYNHMQLKFETTNKELQITVNTLKEENMDNIQKLKKENFNLNKNNNRLMLDNECLLNENSKMHAEIIESAEVKNRMEYDVNEYYHKLELKSKDVKRLHGINHRMQKKMTKLEKKNDNLRNENKLIINKIIKLKKEIKENKEMNNNINIPQEIKCERENMLNIGVLDEISVDCQLEGFDNDVW